jgi:OFA family oxalate/formate antiporter-like MFS transporter
MDTATGRGVDGNLNKRRWVQLAVGVTCMVMIANLQYGWTLFVNPIQDKFHWSKEAIQGAFTLFVLAETWLVPLEGYIVDRFGPRIATVLGGILVGVSWVMNSFAGSIAMLYTAAIIGGVGAGAVYGTCVGNALKWFPDRRGLAAGLTAMGFGAGSALTVIPISTMIKSAGFEATFFRFGIGQGLVVFILGWFLAQPTYKELDALPRAPVASVSRKDYTPLEMVRIPVFWLLYVMFVLMAAGGLMATAQLAPIAKDFKVADVSVSLAGLTLPALTFALSLDRVLNGLTRPFFGWVSDRIGRENTMFIAFLLEGIGILCLNQFGQSPLAFVLLSAVVFFGWGEIYSLFPSTCGDSFGPRYAAANAGLLYTAKGTAALLVPLSSRIAKSAGWRPVFLAAALMNVVAALLAILVLKPMRRRLAARSARAADEARALLELQARPAEARAAAPTNEAESA